MKAMQQEKEDFYSEFEEKYKADTTWRSSYRIPKRIL